MKKIIFFLSIILFANCTRSSAEKASNDLPDFRGFIPSKTSLDDFKKSDDFKKCKEIKSEFYQDLAYAYECSNLSPHIDKLHLYFNRTVENNILFSLNVKFKDEKNIRSGSQAVYDSILAKLATNNIKPSKAMSRDQVIDLLDDDQFRAECGTTQCNGEWRYHSKVQSTFKSMWYASGPAMLELSMKDSDHFLNLVKAAQDRIDKDNLKKAGSLGI